MTLRVFVSSVIRGYEQLRDEACQAIRDLGHEAIRAEDFPGSAQTPRVACLAGVRSADVLVLIAGARYGQTQRDGLSATHEEFREARDRRAVLALIEEGVEREPQQERFVAEVQDWAAGVYTKSFSTPGELRSSVTRLLHQHELSLAAGPPDEREMLGRAIAMLPEEDRGQVASDIVLATAIAGGPRQEVLRPSQIEDRQLEDQLYRTALFGDEAVFTRAEGMEKSVKHGALFLRQQSGAVGVASDGTLLVTTRVDREGEAGWRVLVEENVRERLNAALWWLSTALQIIDPNERLSHVVIALRLIGAEYTEWQTERDSRRRREFRVTSLREDDATAIHLERPALPRAALRTQRDQLVEDLMVLLRRRRQEG